ncbi:MAG: GxxExxY protein [bacterium]
MTTVGSDHQQMKQMQQMPCAGGRDPRTYAILGAAMEVHSEVGAGYLERGYQACLARELALRRIPFEREVELMMAYKGQPVDCSYRVDFVAFGEVLIELKAIREVGGVERAQILNYLKMSGLDTGLLVNFGAERLEWERFTWFARKTPSSVSSVPSVESYGGSGGDTLPPWAPPGSSPLPSSNVVRHGSTQTDSASSASSPFPPPGHGKASPEKPS